MKNRKQYRFTVPGRPNTNHRGRAVSSLEVVIPKKADKNGVMRSVRNKVEITSKVGIFPDTKYVKWKNLVRKIAMDAGVEKLERAKLEIYLHVPCKGTKYVKKQNYIEERLDHPDLDNLKGISDALNGIAWHDDSNVLDPQPVIVTEWMESEWWVEVVITEVHWTDYLSQDCINKCEKLGYKIPYPSDHPSLFTGPEN